MTDLSRLIKVNSSHDSHDRRRGIAFLGNYKFGQHIKYEFIEGVFLYRRQWVCTSRHAEVIRDYTVFSGGRMCCLRGAPYLF